MSGRTTIIIKALNEERHIARAIASALEALRHLDGEVVLADSASTDRTVEIARGFDVDIITLADTADRSCGVGAQLGYQIADGDYIYILDGDMELRPGFLEAAIARIEADPSLGGVAGLVEELGGGNYEFEVRKSFQDGQLAGPQTALDMGGLYRRSAIEAVGYLTNRNLHSYEEKELGWRLARAGYRLERINVPAVRHHGKADSSFGLLGKRWRSRHYDGPGEWIRAAASAGRGLEVALRFKRLWLIVLGWLATLLAIAAVPWSIRPILSILILNLLLLSRLRIKHGSFAMAWSGYLHLQVLTAAMLRGLFSPQEPPMDPIAAVIVQKRERVGPNVPDRC